MLIITNTFIGLEENCTNVQQNVTTNQMPEVEPNVRQEYTPVRMDGMYEYDRAAEV